MYALLFGWPLFVDNIFNNTLDNRRRYSKSIIDVNDKYAFVLFPFNCIISLAFFLRFLARSPSIFMSSVYELRMRQNELRVSLL